VLYLDCANDEVVMMLLLFSLDLSDTCTLALLRDPVCTTRNAVPQSLPNSLLIW
jgi:hypothetical protein